MNYYVKCNNVAPTQAIPKDHAELCKAPWNLDKMNVVILTEADYETIISVNDFCRQKGIKFISCDCYGVFGRLFNDFGDEFDVLDKNGNEIKELLVKNISSEEKGIVTLYET